MEVAKPGGVSSKDVWALPRWDKGWVAIVCFHLHFLRTGNLCNIGHEQSIISAWGIPLTAGWDVSPFRAYFR
jgi:hypothetical protein